MPRLLAIALALALLLFLRVLLPSFILELPVLLFLTLQFVNFTLLCINVSFSLSYNLFVLREILLCMMCFLLSLLPFRLTVQDVASRIKPLAFHKTTSMSDKARRRYLPRRSR